MKDPSERGFVHSIQERLRNVATACGVPYGEVLQDFGIERLLYRISRADAEREFVLKGATLLRLWLKGSARHTRDVDLLGPSTLDAADLATRAVAWLTADVERDGMAFDERGVRIQPIRRAMPNVGTRITFEGGLGQVRLRFQVDVGIGDAVVPAPVLVAFPTLLKLPTPSLFAYTPYSAVAEKFEAMLVLGDTNSRLKDYFDIAMLSSHLGFDGETLCNAIVATFARRSTSPPGEVPPALRDSFAQLTGKREHWAAFLRRNRLQPDAELASFVARVRAFLVPVAQAAASSRTFCAKWPPGGPWQ